MELVYIRDDDWHHGQVADRERALEDLSGCVYSNVYGPTQILPFLKHIPEVTMLSSTQVINDVDSIEVGIFLWMGQWKNEYDILVDKCKKFFLVGDLNTCGQNLTTYEVFSRFKDDISAVLAFCPSQVNWVEKVTGCPALFYPPVLYEDSNSVIFPVDDKDREIIVFSEYHQRGGLGAFSFVNAHYDVNEFDIMRRGDSECGDMHTVGYDKNILPQLDKDSWYELLGRYKFVVDGCDIFHQGRVGLDGLLNGTCYVGMRGMSYMSYLFDEIAFDMHDLGSRPNDDIYRVFSNAVSKIVTMEQLESEVLYYL